MKRKPITLKDIKPNRGIHSKYRAELNGLLRLVRNDVNQLVKNYWENPEPVQAVRIALDQSAGDWLAKQIDLLMIKWLVRLNNLANPMAESFVKRSAINYDNNLKQQLKRNGFTVQLQLSDYAKEALRASVGENVGLIRSIPSEYLADVSKYVWEATSGGFNLSTLTDNLQHAYHIGRNRAKLIARDQANKANAVIEQARRVELGIKKAIWHHSSAAKVPRQSHVKFHGKEFDVEKGAYIDGEYILPGQKINCGCTSRSVIEF